MYFVDASVPREPAFLSSDFQDSFTSRLMLPSSTSDQQLGSVLLPPSSDPQPGTSSDHQGLNDSQRFGAQCSFRQAPPSSRARHKPMSVHQPHVTRTMFPPYYSYHGQYTHHGQGPFHHRVHRGVASSGVVNADVSQLPHATSQDPGPAGVMKKRRSSHFSPDMNHAKKSPDLGEYHRCRFEHTRRVGPCRYSPRPVTSQRYISEQLVADSTNGFFTQPCPVDLSSTSGSDTSDCDSDIDIINPGLLCSSSTCLTRQPGRPEPFMPLGGEEELSNYANSVMPSVDAEANLDFDSNVLNYGNDASEQLQASSIEPSVSQHGDAVVGEVMSLSPQQHVIIDKNDDTDSDVEVVSVVTR